MQRSYVRDQLDPQRRGNDTDLLPATFVLLDIPESTKPRDRKLSVGLPVVHVHKGAISNISSLNKVLVMVLIFSLFFPFSFTTTVTACGFSKPPGS